MRSDISKADRVSEASEFPKVILIDNCNACNLQCSMCDHKNMKRYRKVQLMDMETYQTFNISIPDEYKADLAPGKDINYLEALGRKKITRV